MSSAIDLGLEVVNEVKLSLGDDYDTLTDEQKGSILETATLLMEKEIALATETDEAKKKGLKDQIQALESTVSNWKVWGELAIEDAFWKGVQKVAATIGSFLAAFATEAISRIVPGL